MVLEGCLVISGKRIHVKNRIRVGKQGPLAHIIHERFYSNHRHAAETSLAASFLRPGGQARFS